LFSGLLKQVNIVVEGKTKHAIFAPFSVSVIFFLRLAKNSETKIFIITARFFFFGLSKLRNSKLRKEKKRKKIQ